MVLRLSEDFMALSGFSVNLGLVEKKSHKKILAFWHATQHLGHILLRADILETHLQLNYSMGVAV